MNIEKVIIQRGRRASPEQKGALLSYLEENINFAHERFESDAGVNTQQQKWQDLSIKLNAMGGALKSPEQWKQYWRDFKRNVKAKAAEEKRQIEASGINGMRKIKSLDEFERRAISIMTTDVVDGDGASQEQGFCNLRTVSYQDIVELNISEISIQPPLDIIPETPTVHVGNITTERRGSAHRVGRRRGAAHRLGEHRGRTGENFEINQYLELEKSKLALKRDIFESQKQIEKDKLVIEKQKADALTSMSEIFKDLKNLMEIKYN